jgi:hypothetical protein
MTTNMNNLSRPQRQTLASQIDRLENILTGLPESLGQTVAEAVQDAVGKAVELAVKEVLTNPEVLRALQAPTASTAEQTKSEQEGSLAKTFGQTWQRTRENATWQRTCEKASSAGTALRQNAGSVWSWLGGVCSGIGGGLKTAWTATCAGCGKLASGCVAFCQMLPALLMLLWAYRKPLLIALTVGLIVGLGSYWAGPFVASFVSGLLAFVGALVVNLVRRLQQVMEAVRLPGHWAR